MQIQEITKKNKTGRQAEKTGHQETTNPARGTEDTSNTQVVYGGDRSNR